MEPKGIMHFADILEKMFKFSPLKNCEDPQNWEIKGHELPMNNYEGLQKFHIKGKTLLISTPAMSVILLLFFFFVIKSWW